MGFRGVAARVSLRGLGPQPIHLEGQEVTEMKCDLEQQKIQRRLKEWALALGWRELDILGCLLQSGGN